MTVLRYPQIRSLMVGSVAWLWLLASLVPFAATAQEPYRNSTVIVGLYVSPPFVMARDRHYSGMAVELWNSLAAELGVRSDFRVFPTVGALVEATANGSVDVAVTNLTITKARAQRIDFTQPWFDAGQRILVRRREDTGFWAVMNGLAELGNLRTYGWIAAVVAAATVLTTMFDRRFAPDFPRRWRDGLAENFFSVMMIASGKPPAAKSRFGWVGRIWQAFWIVFGVAVVAYITSSVTAVMTTLSLASQINSLADLPGKTVAVFAGSVSEDFANQERFDLRSFSGIEDAAAALMNGEVNAVVGDAPVLEYYVHTNPQLALDVVGGIFEPDKYAFGLSHRSAITEPLTLQVLGAQENDFVDELRIKYFGEPD